MTGVDFGFKNCVNCGWRYRSSQSCKNWKKNEKKNKWDWKLNINLNENEKL